MGVIQCAAALLPLSILTAHPDVVQRAHGLQSYALLAWSSWALQVQVQSVPHGMMTRIENTFRDKSCHRATHICR